MNNKIIPSNKKIIISTPNKKDYHPCVRKSELLNIIPQIACLIHIVLEFCIITTQFVYFLHFTKIQTLATSVFQKNCITSPFGKFYNSFTFIILGPIYHPYWFDTNLKVMTLYIKVSVNTIHGHRGCNITH